MARKASAASAATCKDLSRPDAASQARIKASSAFRHGVLRALGSFGESILIVGPLLAEY